MKIALITHYFPPEVGAPQARLFEMSKEWVALGHDVTVVTCFPNHPTGIIPEGYRGKRSMSEEMSGIRVERCAVYATPNKGFLKKILGHLSFMVTAVWQGRKYVKGSDIIVVSSPTFFSVISAYVISKMYKIPYVFEVRDLWPAIFKDLGVLKNKVILGVLEALEMQLYRSAAAVVPVTYSFAENIISRGIDAKKVFTITNGVDLEHFSPRGGEEFSRRRENSEGATNEQSTTVSDLKSVAGSNLKSVTGSTLKSDENALSGNNLKIELGLDGKFVVLYIGAHGISQALSAIVRSAEQLKENTDIHFLFVGEGAEKEKIMTLATGLGLENVTFLGSQPKEKMTEFYSMMDVGLVPLRDIPLFDTFIPSKMFEMMGMAKPIVASVRGEAAGILEKSGGAIVCDPENVGQIADAVLALQKDEDHARKLGESGRAFVAKNYDRRLLAKTYVEKLAEFLV